jgi:UDP-N-acetylenolpyruvoylglucosamine reductase
VAHSHAKEFEKFKCPNYIFEGHELLKAFGHKSHIDNFILPVFQNTQDIAALAKRARDHVKDAFGITLVAEVNLIGVEI